MYSSLRHQVLFIVLNLAEINHLKTASLLNISHECGQVWGQFMHGYFQPEGFQFVLSHEPLRGKSSKSKFSSPHSAQSTLNILRELIGLGTKQDKMQKILEGGMLPNRLAPQKNVALLLNNNKLTKNCLSVFSQCFITLRRIAQVILLLWRSHRHALFAFDYLRTSI